MSTEIKGSTPPAISAEDHKFLTDTAYPNLTSTKCNDTLKHTADMLWNLCQWEKQRADVLDTKAQSLLGMASIATAIVAVAAPTTASFAVLLKVTSALLFLTTATLALVALRIADYKGFLDTDVLGALKLHETEDPATKDDKDQFRVYLRDTIAQRVLVYRSFVARSAEKATRVENAQVAAILALFALVALIVVAVLGV